MGASRQERPGTEGEPLVTHPIEFVIVFKPERRGAELVTQYGRATPQQVTEWQEAVARAHNTGDIALVITVPTRGSGQDWGGGDDVRAIMVQRIDPLVTPPTP